ncbi:MAG: 30S ribosomal protein S4 [bacterium]|nr:30S ribosomal protein S4 [bacterium]
MKNNKCKICRRSGLKLFLKGERCLSQKCSMIKKPYPPGPKSKKRVKALSEYGKELKEKQKLKNWYNLEERQFQKHVKEVLKARGKVVDAGTALIQILESRLDNVVFRLGLAPARAFARQTVSHRHFMINGKPIDIPSYLVKKGDKISISSSSVKKTIFQKLPTLLKKYNPPSWLKLDVENLEGKVIDLPNLEEAALPAELSSVFEFYSK